MSARADSVPVESEASLEPSDPESVKVFIRIEGLKVHAGNLIVVQSSNIDLMVLRSITIQSYTQCSARVLPCEFPPESYFQVLFIRGYGLTRRILRYSRTQTLSCACRNMRFCFPPTRLAFYMITGINFLFLVCIA